MNIGGPCQAIESVFIGPVGHFRFVEIQGLAEKLFPVQNLSQGQPGRRNLCGKRVILWGRTRGGFAVFSGIPVQNLSVPPFGLGPVSRLKGFISHVIEGAHGQFGGCFFMGFSQPGQGLNPGFNGISRGIGQMDVNHPFHGSVGPWGIRVLGDDGKVGGRHRRGPAHAAVELGLLKYGFCLEVGRQILQCRGLVQEANGFCKRRRVPSQLPQQPGLGHESPCPDALRIERVDARL